MKESTDDKTAEELVLPDDDSIALSGKWTSSQASEPHLVKMVTLA